MENSLLTYTKPTKYPELLSYLSKNSVSLIGIVPRLGAERAGILFARGYLCSSLNEGPPPNHTNHLVICGGLASHLSHLFASVTLMQYKVLIRLRVVTREFLLISDT